MAEQTRFKHGDVVVHTRRLEWGDGIVDRATVIHHQGRPAQRLEINFTHHGRVTINTAVAPLVPKGTPLAMSTTASSTSPTTTTQTGGWLGALIEKNDADVLVALPEAMTDPFAPLAVRLQATLDSYRFSTEPRSLIEWAVAQTALHDPLSKYTRHELEQAFPRFARDRDQLLVSLVRTIKKQLKTDLLNQALKNTRHGEARAALKKAIRA